MRPVRMVEVTRVLVENDRVLATIVSPLGKPSNAVIYAESTLSQFEVPVAQSGDAREC